VRRARLLENRSTFVHSSAGGKNIINEDNAPVHHYFGLPKRKSPGYIPYTLNSCQFHLRPGMPSPAQVVAGERDTVCFAHPVRKKERLIEAPFFQPAHVERHRHNKVNVPDHMDIR
jgi:hypothetical protein